MKPSAGMRYRKVDRRPLHLKIRVILTEPMSEERARAKLMQAVDTGRVPKGIEIRWIDWEKGTHGQARGKIKHDVAKALQDFAGAINAGEPRFAPVSPPGGHRPKKSRRSRS